jgi:hypothetical protein
MLDDRPYSVVARLIGICLGVEGDGVDEECH